LSKENIIGTCDSIITQVRTMSDGSARVSFDINPNQVKTIKNLLEAYLSGKTYVQLAVVYIGDKNE